MTIAEIKQSDKPMLRPADIAPVLQMDAQAIRDTAAYEPERLGFPVIRIGRRTKIPRIPFLKFLGYEVET